MPFNSYECFLLLLDPFVDDLCLFAIVAVELYVPCRGGFNWDDHMNPPGLIHPMERERGRVQGGLVQ